MPGIRGRLAELELRPANGRAREAHKVQDAAPRIAGSLLWHMYIEVNAMARS